MTLVTLDVVLLLPAPQRTLAIAASDHLATIMNDVGGAAFRLGHQFPGRSDGDCEPHVTLFMLAVEDHEIPDVAAAVGALTLVASPVAAIATEYRHNHEGAPEVFFSPSDEFRAVQRHVISVVEPLRRGRLRDVDPAGNSLAAVVDDLNPADPGRVSQLRRYGFDDVSDDVHDRFHPHVTLSWPIDETSRVDLDALPAVADFSSLLTDLALYEMGPNGTCTRRHGSWTLTGTRP